MAAQQTSAGDRRQDCASEFAATGFSTAGRGAGSLLAAVAEHLTCSAKTGQLDLPPTLDISTAAKEVKAYIDRVDFVGTRKEHIELSLRRDKDDALRYELWDGERTIIACKEPVEQGEAKYSAWYFRGCSASSLSCTDAATAEGRAQATEMLGKFFGKDAEAVFLRISQIEEHTKQSLRAAQRELAENASLPEHESEWTAAPGGFYRLPSAVCRQTAVTNPAVSSSILLYRDDGVPTLAVRMDCGVFGPSWAMGQDNLPTLRVSDAGVSELMARVRARLSASKR